MSGYYNQLQTRLRFPPLPPANFHRPFPVLRLLPKQPSILHSLILFSSHLYFRIQLVLHVLFRHGRLGSWPSRRRELAKGCFVWGWRAMGLYVTPISHSVLRPWTSANKWIARKLLEKSELLKGLMQGMYSLSWFGRVVYWQFVDVPDDTGPIPLNNVSMNVLKKVASLNPQNPISFWMRN